MSEKFSFEINLGAAGFLRIFFVYFFVKFGILKFSVSIRDFMVEPSDIKGAVALLPPHDAAHGLLTENFSS